jgi:hypothetical protein
MTDKRIIGLPDVPVTDFSVNGIASQLRTIPNPLLDANHSISPASGYFGSNWPASGAIPQRFSAGGWTVQNRGFAQQTFLGASIRSFSMNGGFGDSSSTLSVELINDEFNKSDTTAAGYGDDIYHSGVYDNFAPPIVGSPVFFKFGENLATVQEAYRQTLDDLYNMNTFGANPAISSNGSYDPDNFLTLNNGQYVDLETNTFKNLTAQITGPNRGRNHIVFGGILQSYTQNRGPGGNPAYSVQVIDPREILSNTVLLLNNYAGTIYNQTNMLNIYGFLEYNPTDATKIAISAALPQMSVLTKSVDTNGIITFTGDDTYSPNSPIPLASISATSFPKSFPITGTGFARRGPQGIPYYRVKQAVNALMQYDGVLPPEFGEKGFGGAINFRGFNYVIDFGTLPDLPGLYYLDFDQINLLELALEICDITSRELFVTLLPIIDHPACKFLHSWNTAKASSSEYSKLIAGIIRLDAIDRSKQPTYGSVKKYIDDLALQNPPIYVENQDVGYELSNITTDKFIVGAQEIDMHYFSGNADRDELEVANQALGQAPNTPVGDQWKLETSLKQQILPYYGMLGKHAVTIPKGFGAYQQILLDATSLNAHGVGAYYVATEMELRCAMISFDRWKDFLKLYNDTYLESVEVDDSQDTAGLIRAVAPPNSPPIYINRGNYAVTVPRSVFDTYSTTNYGEDGLPYSPCNPPYGYPLYYKRMTKIGIPEGGLTDIQSRYTTVMTNFAELQNTKDNKNFRVVLDSQFQRLKQIKEAAGLTEFEQSYYDSLEALLNDPTPKKITETVALVEQSLVNNKEVFSVLPKIAKKNTENAMKVYDFVKNVAEECLGKKFLVKIPKRVNLFYENGIAYKGGNRLNNNSREYSQGPFGFKPRPISSVIGYEFSTAFKTAITTSRSSFSSENMMKTFLSSSGTFPTTYVGALNANYNPIVDQYEYNYTPVNQGGFFDFDLFQNTIATSAMNNIVYDNLQPGVKQCLIPQDLTNFLGDNGRITPYVRFDHSEHLSLEYVNKSDITQQVKVAESMVPDLSYALDNVNGVPFSRFPDEEARDRDKQKDDLPEQVAFVKCTVDENFYMPPKTSIRPIKVHGQNIKDIGQKSLPQKIYLPDEDKYVDSFTYYQAHYVPEPEGGAISNVLDFNRREERVLKTNLVITEMEELDTNHVYALITLPGRIVPTKDARFRDGPFQKINGEKFKHLMTMDTVTGLEGFDIPAFIPKPSIDVLNNFGGRLTQDQKFQSALAAKKAMESLSFGFPQQVNFTMPSPIYPNLVALPLMSKERCYGPWVSSQLDTQATVFRNIGGRVEFIKDENLSPWNYAGYQLMHEAGRLQASFSNSLMLFSERGGFSFPGLPSGASLGKALINGGPLVTSLDISVSEGGVKTTCKMDLYTSSFGKLQKQKQDEISKISRERQRLRDERNALIRKGLGKSQTGFNYQNIYNAFNSGKAEDILQFGSPLTQIVASVKTYTTDQWSSNPPNASQLFGNSSPSTGSSHTKTDRAVESSIQDNKQIGKVAQQFLDSDSMAKAFYDTAAMPIAGEGGVFTPISNEPFHPNMASKPSPFSVAKSQFYIDQVTNPTYDDSDVTKYGDV